MKAKNLIDKKFGKFGGNNFKHGYARLNKKSKTYNVWASMIQRCTNRNCKKYKDYGERGITVCDRWMPKNNGFINFLADMGECPPGLTLDRIKNNKLKNGYSPKNCQWTTIKNQERNRRNNHLLKYDGKELCLAEWEEVTGIKQSIIKKRIKRGWSIKKALTTPVKIRKGK